MIKLLIAIFILTTGLQARYVCTQDPVFIDWLSQMPVDVNNDSTLVKYSDMISCKSQCKISNTCLASNGKYTCPLFASNVNLGGDAGLNLFSSLGVCESKCFVQHNCTEWTENPKCSPASFEKSHPISDWTGKTVFTKYNITWDCDTSKVASGECLSYTTQIIDDNTTFDMSKVGWQTKDFASADEAMTATAGMEQLQHIWSGWNGMCENGMKFDNSWMSDPMTLLSMASMAYTGALTGGYGEAAQYQAGVTHNAVLRTFDNATSGVTQAFSNASSSVSNAFTSSGQIISTTSETAEAASSAAGTANEAWSQVQTYWNTELVGATDYTTAVTYGSATFDVARVAMAAFSEPSNDDYAIADNFMKAQLGQDTSSIAAVNYSQCMAAIGLNFPNTVGHAVGDKESMSTQLLEPWKNPIYLSDNQLAYLMQATSPNFVEASYIRLSEGRYIAITSLAYQQAGQIVCGGGKAAVAMNIRNQTASDQDKGGINGAAMANAAISSAMGYLPPPYNLMASIAFKMLTSISNGNACTSEEISQKWGIQQNKTYKALTHKQCHYIEDQCAAKWAWGSCMRKRNHYCCYDQEMTRIFVEGIKLQLEKKWEKNKCDDISLEDLKNISFRKCLTDESPANDKCFPVEKWAELNETLTKQTTKNFDAKSLVDSAMDSMPMASDPWGPRIGD